MTAYDPDERSSVEDYLDYQDYREHLLEQKFIEHEEQLRSESAREKAVGPTDVVPSAVRQQTAASASKRADTSKAMPETPGTPGAGATPKPNLPRRGAHDGAQGAGAYLTPGIVGPRGREFTVVGSSWEPNYDEDALIPCLHLGAEDGEDPILFKITTKGNNRALDECGAGGTDESSLATMTGTAIFVQATTVRTKSGESKVSLQIGEVLREGKTIWRSIPAQ